MNARALSAKARCSSSKRVRCMPPMLLHRRTLAQPMDELGDEVTAWLAAHFRNDLPKREWLAMVVDAGYAVPTWPAEWFGRGLDARAAATIGTAFAAVGAPGARQDRHNLSANTLLAFGTETLKRELIRPLLLDEVTMCLLYS